MSDIRRRKFISLLGGMVASLPLTARAEQPAMPVVGWLNLSSAGDRETLVDAFRRGLSDTGYVEGRTVTIEYRWAEYRAARLPALAADLVARQVAVIAATGGIHSALAAKALTSTIPVVFTSGVDPVQTDLVADLHRPGGNLTGISWFSSQLTAKGLGLLRELVPNTAVVALLWNPSNPEAAPQPADMLEASRLLGPTLLVLSASTVREIDRAFEILVRQGTGALVVAGDAFLSGRRDQIVALAARHALPSIYFNREFVLGGGLMSYGNDIADAYRRAGVYTGRILKGARPSELPIDQATNFELVINLKSAKALGLDVPPTLLARADEVIK
jgi:ABC-type uncharacterized transport system substrate-binding protein